PHGVVMAPDGDRIYITNESLSTLDVVDAKTLKITKRIRLSGRPNNLGGSKNGAQVYEAIFQAQGAVEVIDSASLSNVERMPLIAGVHNVYVTPDGKFAVAGSSSSSTISVIDTSNNTVAWTKTLDAGIRPMAFPRNPDGSTKQIVAQLTNFHGFVVVD